MINRPVVTKLWVNRRVRAHCERCYDDKEETSEMQAERFRRQRRSGDRRVAHQGHRVMITVDKVQMLRNKANGPADCLVTEMLQCLLTETTYEVAHCVDKRFKGECRAPEAWKILRLVFLEKACEFRVIALLCVFSKWNTIVVVDMLHDEKEPSEWKRLHVGAERGLN